ncbi:MAG: helix-turn-helix domain-containing protein [Gammaproteobacteria bacterium]|nr:helix-turn-helix domain-containing protein [Gammaproteobacteria bacterium]
MSKLIKTAVETAKDLGLNVITLREIEALDLPEVVELSSKQIRIIRTEAHVSQAVIAKYLNVSLSTYQKWERGKVTPHGGNLKLLNLAYKRGLQTLV